MPETQPWKKERNAPPEQAAVLLDAGGWSPRSFLLSWWPALAWAGLIFYMSTDTFSAEHTGGVLQDLVAWLHLSDSQFQALHFFIRKTAHFTEYFVFYLLLYRGIRGPRRGWRWIWGLSAWFVAAAYSALDEIHQAFVASRTASAYDSLLDSIGALVALIVLYLYFCPPSPPARARE